MRPIEFRVWHTPTQQMYYVQAFFFVQGIVFVQAPKDGTTPGCKLSISLKVDECVVMQYTGTLDRDGAKIWEGDIMRYGESKKDYDYLEVIFLNGTFGTPDSPIYPFLEIFTVQQGGNHCDKVVGNIYQHAYLLDLKQQLV